MCKGFLLLEYIDEKSCWLTGFININPKFAYIPDWFLNYLVKRSIYSMTHRISEKENYENEEVTKKMEEKIQFWDHIRERLKEITQA